MSSDAPGSSACGGARSTGADNVVRRGSLIVISGPSGAGKTSICHALLERVPGSIWSVSVTTRPQRPGDIAGESYDFVTREVFQSMRDRDEFLESAEYIGNLYGTREEPVRRATADGKCVILEIDVQGGMQVAERMPESVRIFVLPPTRETLEARLKGRKTESEDQLKKRLAEADGEIAAARDSGAYSYFVTNDILEDTIEEVIGIIEKETGGPWL